MDDSVLSNAKRIYFKNQLTGRKASTLMLPFSKAFEHYW